MGNIVSFAFWFRQMWPPNTDFLERMNKLTLKKTGDKPRKKNEDIPCTLDAFEKESFEDDDIDFTLTVTDINPTTKREEDKTGEDFAEIISSAVKELRTKMTSDLKLRKRESRTGICLKRGEQCSFFLQDTTVMQT